MFPMQVQYQVSLSDFQKATYYALVLRHRKAITIMLIVIAGALLYALGAALGFGKANMLVFFLAGAYLIWGLLLFAGAQRGIRRYLRTKDSLIGCEYSAVLEEHRVAIRVPERGISVSYPVKKLACVFELSSIFLLYISSQETYILPKRAISEEQQYALRQNFRRQLKDRFSSRFDQKKKRVA